MTPAHSYFKELHDRTTTLLHKTISIQPSLAGLITSLILGFRMSLKYTVEAVEAFITYSNLCVAILACCPNVERFMVFGLARASKCLLLQTIKTRPQLRILHMTLRDGWERDTGPLIAEYDFTDFQDILASCRQLQLLSFFDVPFTPSAPAACTVGGHLKRLNLEKVAMSDAQIVGLMATLAESLETLHISHDITNWEYKRAEYSYSALKEALALLKKLKYLHLNIEQNYPLNDLDETLLLPLTELRTVYITPLLFPFSGLAHLASPHLEHFHIWAVSGVADPHNVALVILPAVAAMLPAPQFCPKVLSIAHQIRNEEDPDIPMETVLPLNEDLVADLTSRCAAVGVHFEYMPFLDMFDPN